MVRITFLLESNPSGRGSCQGSQHKCKHETSSSKSCAYSSSVPRTAAFLECVHSGMTLRWRNCEGINDQKYAQPACLCFKGSRLWASSSRGWLCLARPRKNRGLPSSAPTEPASRPCAVLYQMPVHIPRIFFPCSPLTVWGRGDRLYFVLFDCGGKEHRSGADHGEWNGL